MKGARGSRPSATVIIERNVLRLRTLGGLWIEAADGSRLPNPRPRRLALIAVLAAAGPRGVSRSRLRAIFWPDAEDDASRQALRQTIYALHRDLGVRAVAAGPDLRLDSAAVSCDADEFRAALARRDWQAAQAAYQGPFAAGFSLDDAPEFERWLDEVRVSFHHQAQSALEALVREAETAGDRPGAARAWQRLSDLDPLSARYAAGYMSALAAAGDRSGALAHARRHAGEVRRELEAEPDPVVVRLEAELRAAAAPVPEPPATRPAVPEPGQPAPALEPPPARRAPRRRVVGLAVVAAALAVLAIAMARFGRGAPGPPVLAVGYLRDLTQADPTGSGAVLSALLTTSLARLVEVEVIANSRIIELLEPGRDPTGTGRTDAARRAGASEVIEGELVAAGSGRVRLDLRRVAITRGAVRGAYSVSGADPLVLIDSATALLAADLDLRRPARALAELTPRSPVALRLYEEGLRAYYQGQTAIARRLFREALGEDSTFALAAYFANRAHSDRWGRDAALEARALELSVRAPDRDRLIIQTALRRAQYDTLALVFADSLATRFPRDPEALIRAAEALTTFRLIGSRERDLLERAIAIDSAAGFNPRAPCRICDAFGLLVPALRWADSGAAAASVARRWLALLPGDPGAKGTLALLHFSEGRYEAGAAELATVEGTELEGPGPGTIFLGRLLTGRLDEADAECMVHLGREDRRGLDGYRWLCPIVWRNQGRYRDAASLVIAARLPGGRPLARRPPRDPVGEFVLDLETSRFRSARRAIETAVPQPVDSVPAGLFARELTWSLVRRGTVAAMAREIEVARRLADSAEVIGRSSLFGRDRLLHYFIRGLIAQTANDHATAADLFRRSIFSWTFGYTRANFEMARSLLATGRAGEAVLPLQAALRGGWDGSNLYVTRTELHELLAQAFVAVGRPDSAAAHYALVERAWRRADPQFAARYQAARDYVARHGVGLQPTTLPAPPGASPF